MDWRLLAGQKALMSFDKSAIKDISWLIPFEELYKLDIDMQGPLWRVWGWIFGKQIQQHDTKKLYSLLHWKNPLSPVLNAKWISFDSED
jgi:hypothetical protein